MVLVFEGIDGSGKDTQIDFFTKYLDTIDKKYEVINTLSSELISPVIRTKLKQEDVNDNQMAGLFIAELWEHYPKVRDAYDNYKTLILNRWWPSTIAYNSSSIANMKAIKDLLPNIPVAIFYLEVSVETALARIQERNKDRDVYENEGKLRTVLSYYSMLKKYQNIDVFNGEEPPYMVAEKIRRRYEFLTGGF